MDYGADFIVQSIDLMQSELGTWRLERTRPRIGAASERMTMGCIARLGCLFVLVVLARGRLVHARHVDAATRYARQPCADRRRRDGTLGAAVRRRRRHDASGAEAAERSRAARSSRRCRRRRSRRTPSASREAAADRRGQRRGDGERRQAFDARRGVASRISAAQARDAVGMLHDRETRGADGNASACRSRASAEFEVQTREIRRLPIPQGHDPALIDARSDPGDARPGSRRTRSRCRSPAT